MSRRISRPVGSLRWLEARIIAVQEFDGTPDEAVTEIMALDKASEAALEAYAALDPILGDPEAIRIHGLLDAICTDLDARLLAAVEQAEEDIKNIRSDRKRR